VVHTFYFDDERSGGTAFQDYELQLTRRSALENNAIHWDRPLVVRVPDPDPVVPVN
jgi:hypothetical protein